MSHSEKQPIMGRAFNDVLSELHAHVFTGVPGESDPFILTLLEREYIAYVLSCYYQCEHCQRHHSRAVKHERKVENRPDWDWQNELVKTILFLRVSCEDITPIEWEQWQTSWDRFSDRLDRHHLHLASYIALAVGIARKDESLMDVAFDSISSSEPDDERLKGIIRDIDRVVIFMKAATSKNRTDPIIIRQLNTRNISAA
jgi:hypothetical protein